MIFLLLILLFICLISFSSFFFLGETLCAINFLQSTNQCSSLLGSSISFVSQLNKRKFSLLYCFYIVVCCVSRFWAGRDCADCDNRLITRKTLRSRAQIFLSFFLPFLSKDFFIPVHATKCVGFQFLLFLS